MPRLNLGLAYKTGVDRKPFATTVRVEYAGKVILSSVI